MAAESRPAEFASLASLAAGSGLDRRTVKAILDREGLQQTPIGYPRSMAEMLIELGHDASLTAGHAVAGRGNVVLPETSRLAAAKASAEEQRARKLAFDNDLREGRYVSLDRLTADVERIASEARERFTNLGARLAHRLTNVVEQRDVKRILDDETRDIANTFADHLAGLAGAPA